MNLDPDTTIEQAERHADDAYLRYRPTVGLASLIWCTLTLHRWSTGSYQVAFDHGYVRVDWCGKCGAPL